MEGKPHRRQNPLVVTPPLSYNVLVLSKRGDPVTKTAKIPKATITRLSIYYRQLELLEFDGYRMVSSEKLAWLCQVNPAQVRKDLGYFGEFGVRGVGYDVIELQNQIKKILALNRDWNLGIVGIGNLGSALLEREDFAARGFKCVAAFDNDPEKIGEPMPSGLTIRDIAELNQVVRELEIEIGVIAVPASAAQGIADQFLNCQVNAILNFSPTQIRVPECCLVENMDFTVKLDILTYKLYHELTA
jgi:redox-sensing transcriptional repressor